MGDAASGWPDWLRDEDRDGPDVCGHGLGPETRGGFRGSTTLSPENVAETIPVVQRGCGVELDAEPLIPAREGQDLPVPKVSQATLVCDG